MPFDKRVLANLGGTAPHNGEFRAHIQLRSEEGTKINIIGPCRTTEDEAQKDVVQIRAAGAVGSTREESLKIMMAEARRIKMAVEYQNQIQQTVERMASREIVDESEVEYDDDDMSMESDPPWMQEYPSGEDTPKDSPQSTMPILTPLEATAELTKFRPIISKPSDLKHLLECKADPNMPLKPGDISPLRKVMSFSAERYVAEMRGLLLQYGANENDKDRERWDLRQGTDVAEKILKNNYKNIDKDYNPWSGNDMDF